jgi:ATP-dependent DNA helicase RecG
MVESWGRGYDKIIEACEETGTALPIVEADFGGLMVRIEESQKFRELRQEHSSLSQDATENATENATEKELLALIAVNPHITQIELANRTKKHRATISRWIKSLKEAGLIERVGSDAKGYWKIAIPDDKE